MVCAPYDAREFLDAVRGLEQVPEGGERCFVCYRLRLEAAARYAKANGFDYFTTTLSISPLKNAAKLNEIGEAFAAQYGVAHLPADFKKKEGYKRSIELSRVYGLYRQDFCGCVFSKRERMKKKMAVTHNGVTYRVADAHAHIYPGKIAEKATANVGRFYDIEMEEVGLPHILSEEGKAAGIDRYLVCSVATKVEQVESINRFIAEKCAKYPAFIGLGAWHQDVADIEGELDRIQALGLRGIKLHPDFQCFNIDDDRMIPVYEACMRRGMVVLFHTGDDRTDFSSPRRLANVLEKLPEFVCIAAHLGGYREWADARAVLHGTNVYIDTSSSLFAVSAEDARRSIAHFGIDKTLFGTDFPMWSPKEELERFFALGYGEAENRRILYDNFAKLFSL